ncbi:MAG TPA: hypothetical protein VF378_08340, partial [Geothrix sp.]
MVTRGGERKGQEARKSRPEPEGLVRLAKAVPTIERQAIAPAREAEPQDNGLPCSGRCGHCDFHPCRLHAPV